MSSETSTNRPAAAADSSFQPRHFYVLLSMIAATAAVVVSRHNHPAALLLISAAVLSAGLVAFAVHRAVQGFLGGDVRAAARPAAREALMREKALVLRTIKELEFDRGLGKIAGADYEDMRDRLRARAMALMEQIDQSKDDEPVIPVPAAPEGACSSCGIINEDDALFCKRCGQRLVPA